MSEINLEKATSYGISRCIQNKFEKRTHCVAGCSSDSDCTMENTAHCPRCNTGSATCVGKYNASLSLIYSFRFIPNRYNMITFPFDLYSKTWFNSGILFSYLCSKTLIVGTL